MELGIEVEQGRAELRQQIQLFLDRKGLKRYQLAEQLGWNRTRFSQLMNDDSFSVEHLDALAKAFDLAEGTFYKYMLTELFSPGGSFRSAQANEFVKRCLEINQRQYILPVLYRMIDRRHAREALFSLAETCFAAGYREDILAFYEIQISDDLNRFSERVAVSYFRRFLILRDRGVKQGLTALNQLAMYISHLPRDLNLEAHLRIITFHYARNDWAEVMEYASSLEQIAQSGTYYGKALMYQSFVERECGNIEKALVLTDRYASIDEFADIARDNRLFIRLKAGDLEVIPELLHLSESQGFVYLDIAAVLEAYVTASRFEETQQLLTVHESDILRLKQDSSPFCKKFRARFSFFYAKYLFQTGNIMLGLLELLEAVELYDWLQDQQGVRNCASLFLRHSDHSTPEIRNRFQTLLEGGKNDEKMVCRDLSGSEPVCP